jgi:hypothetical protein
MRSIGVLFLQGMILAQFSAVDMTIAWFWQRQQSGRGELNLRRVELQLFRVQPRMNEGNEGECWGIFWSFGCEPRPVHTARLQGTTLVHTSQSGES